MTENRPAPECRLTVSSGVAKILLEIGVITIATLFVGIDVGKKSNHIHVLDSDGETLSRFSAPNNLDGAVTIKEKLRRIILDTDFTKVTIGMESTSIYADHLAAFFRNDDFPKTWQCKVYILNAKQVQGFLPGIA